uniref:Putative secreted protein n=1 Tax=Anopheles darlingi TaxID=43151 RepID=A0A2M4DQA7_ANODA
MGLFLLFFIILTVVCFFIKSFNASEENVEMEMNSIKRTAVTTTFESSKVGKSLNSLHKRRLKNKTINK